MTFSYTKNLKILLWAIAGGLFVEGAVAEFVLRIILPHTIWPWLMTAVHVFALAWIAGMYVGMVKRPHRLTSDSLIVHDGFKTTVTVPLAGIRAVRTRTHDNLGRSGFVIDRETLVATVAHGESTVEIELEPEPTIRVNGKEHSTPITTLRITVDNPAEFVATLRGALTVEAAR